MNPGLGYLVISSGVISLVFISVMMFIDMVSTIDHKPVSNYHRNHRGFKCVCHVHFKTPFQIWKHITIEWWDLHFNCWCGHPKFTHTGISGPNSIGRWSHGNCTEGSTIVPPYRIGGCGCMKYKRRPRTFGRIKDGS